jgi:hypothetical protein
MTVARQFIAWKLDHGAPSRRVRYDDNPLERMPTELRLPSRVSSGGYEGDENALGPINHTVPYGTGRNFDVFQAINCLAIIMESLRD